MIFILKRVKRAVKNESSVQKGTRTRDTEKTSLIPEEKKSSSRYLNGSDRLKQRQAVKINRNIFPKESISRNSYQCDTDLVLKN